MAGTSVLWIGIIPANSPPQISTALYSIDGAAFGTANISGSPSTTSSTLFNQVLFQTAPLLNGQHVLEVVYDGNAPQSASLVLDNFIVLNRTSGTTSTTSAPSDATSTTTAAWDNSSYGKSSGTPQAGALPHSHDIGAKAGIAVGGCLAFFGLTIFIFIVYCRRGRFSNNTWYNWTYRYPLHEDGRD